MKAAIFDCFGHHYDIRMKYVKEVLEECGYEVSVYSSDFDHMKKTHILAMSDVVKYIHVPAYKRNLSFARLRSHYVFSVNARKILENSDYALAYCVVPPNSIVNEVGKYKKKNKSIKFVVDICDMWPETFPSGNAKKILALPFGVWRRFRDMRLSEADTVITECELFKEALEKINPEVSGKTLYLCKEQIVNSVSECKKEKDVLDFVYLGSVNNIIDIDFIVEFVGEVAKRKKCRIHIIGNGEKYAEFIDKVKKSGAETFAYGAVYDDNEKKAIFEKCDFAFNIMKKDVFVGLTMKSMDYFSYALPIINNIGGDSQKLVREENLGFNVCREEIGSCVEKITKLSTDDILAMKRNIANVYEKFFSVEVFRDKLKKYLSN